MSETRFFLTVRQLLEIHDRLVDDFGGARGLRDRGLLESAAAMPAAQYNGEYLHPGLAEMAGAYLFHICLNHAFADGNKRTALAAALLFLDLNDHDISASDVELEQLVLDAAQGRRSKQEIAAFFKSAIRKV